MHEGKLADVRLSLGVENVGAADRHGVLHSGDDPVIQPLDLALAEGAGESLGMDARLPQALVGVDVPDSSYHRLIQQRGLDLGSLASRKTLFKEFSGELGGEQIRPQLETGNVVVYRTVRHEPDAPEVPDVGQIEVRVPLEIEAQMGRLVRQWCVIGGNRMAGREAGDATPRPTSWPLSLRWMTALRIVEGEEQVLAEAIDASESLAAQIIEPEATFRDDQLGEPQLEVDDAPPNQLLGNRASRPFDLW